MKARILVCLTATMALLASIKPIEPQPKAVQWLPAAVAAPVSTVPIDVEVGSSFATVTGHAASYELPSKSSGSWTTYTTTHGLANDWVNDIALDEAGHVWFGTQGGVSEFDGSTWNSYTTTHGLLSEYVNAIAVDGAGHMWFGTYGGVSEFDGTNWTNYTTYDGLTSNGVLGIAVDEAGHKWFGTTNGVSRFDGSSWITYTTTHGLVDNYVKALAIDKAGHKWFGTNVGVSEFDGSTWTTYTTTHGLVHEHINAIAVDGAGHKWFGTYGGVSEFDGTNWTTYTASDGLVQNSVYAIAIDRAGRKWFGTCGGVSEFDSLNWTTYTEDDGLADNCVYAIAVDNRGRRWFGTHGAGVSRYALDEAILVVKPGVGGTLIYTGTQGCPTTIQVPEGAVTETTVLIHTSVETATAAFGVTFAGCAFNLDVYRNGLLPAGLTVEEPITVTVHYTDAGTAHLDEDVLELRYWNGSEWSADGIATVECNTVQDYVVATTTHLSRFGLFSAWDLHSIYLPITRYEFNWETISEWTPWSLQGETIRELKAGPDPGWLWNITSEGIYRSKNHGKGWERADVGLPRPHPWSSPYCLAFEDDSSSDTPIYAAIDTQIYVSRDAGTTWSLDADLGRSLDHLDSVDDMLYAATCWPYQVWKRLPTDEWEVVGNELDGSVYDLAVYQSTLYAGTSAGLYRLTENVWEPITVTHYALTREDPAVRIPPVFTVMPQPQVEAPTSAFTVHSILVHDGRMFLGTSTSRGMYRSEDGETWTACDVGLTDPWYLSVRKIVASSTGRLFAATTDGVFVSENQGDRWQALDAGLPHTITGYGVLLDGVTATSLALMRDEGDQQTPVAVFNDEGIWALTVTEKTPLRDLPPKAPPKAVLVVGPIDPPEHAATLSYIVWAEGLASIMERNGMNVVKVYWPNSTWENVRAAIGGASIIVYKGHGFGLGDIPADSTEMYGSLNGFCLVDPTDPSGARLGTQDMLVATNRLAENAIGFFFCCSCAGHSSSDPVPVSEALARRRIEAYASTLLRMGGGGYFSGTNEEHILEDFFAHPNRNLRDLYIGAGGFPEHVYPHILWPDQVVWFDGDTQRGWARAFVGDPNLTGRDVLGR